jgi:hypothetical protein
MRFKIGKQASKLLRYAFEEVRYRKGESPAGRRHNMHMPLTIFDCKGIPATRRERIEATVEAGGKHVAESFEGWIAADPFRGGVRVLITGPQGFERSVMFSIDEDPIVITHKSG